MSLSRSFLSLAPVTTKLTQVLSHVNILTPTTQSTLSTDQVRYRKGKHWAIKWKKFRAAKVKKPELPDYHENENDLTPEERRAKLIKMGVKPIRSWVERPVYISTTGQVFEAYVPPEGDGKLSIVSAAGAKQKYDLLEKKTKSMMAIRKVKTYEEDFNVTDFAKHAQDVYIKAHNYLSQKDKEGLRQTVTERCFPEMFYNCQYKTINWKFLQSLEPPRVVHARVTSVIAKENAFAQITVRLHSQQQLAIYDRFGRLMHGSEIIAKDVLEYIVFEKHLSNLYGSWRLHDKIIPTWMPEREVTSRTHTLDDNLYDFGFSAPAEPEETKTEEKPADASTPPLATA